MGLPDHFLIRYDLTLGELKTKLAERGIQYIDPTPPSGRRTRTRLKESIAGARIRRATQLPIGAYKKTDGRCWYCGTEFGYDRRTQPTLDHIKPLARGGSNCIDNLIPACYGCNQLKADKTLDEFRRMHGPFYGESQ